MSLDMCKMEFYIMKVRNSFHTAVGSEDTRVVGLSSFFFFFFFLRKNFKKVQQKNFKKDGNARVHVCESHLSRLC